MVATSILLRQGEIENKRRGLSSFVVHCRWSEHQRKTIDMDYIYECVKCMSVYAHTHTQTHTHAGTHTHTQTHRQRERERRERNAN